MKRSSSLAPIVLFTYKRLGTLKRTVEALQNNFLASESELFIFSDGYKNENDKMDVLRVREYLKTVGGFKNIRIIESNMNKGLANSIIEGVTFIFESYNSVIVLEDDLKSSKNFLTFMNDSIQLYEENNRVFSISGYSFDLSLKITEDCYFLNRGWSWGWATWKDRWEKIDWEIKDYPDFILNSKERKKFAEGGSDLNAMLNKQMNGKLDSWAVRWFYNQYKVKGITLFPVYSKIQNLGFGENATHTSGSKARYNPLFDNIESKNFVFPKLIEIQPNILRKFQLKMGYFQRTLSKIRTILKLG